MKTLLANIYDQLHVRIDLNEFAELQAQYMREELPKLISVDNALLKFLQVLNEHGLICAVVTTAQRSGTDIKLDILGIRQYFSLVVTGNDIENHKPHPEAYLVALEKLGISPTECVIFEDSLPGVQAGQAAGCPVIGFTQYNPPAVPLPGVLATVRRWSDIDYQKLQQLLEHKL
jgi:HAD superfamily hydrolase (TIGR01509 family)